MLKFNYKKELLLISLLFIICLSISAVSAADVNNNDASSDISVSVLQTDVDFSNDISTVQADANIGNGEISNNISFSQKNSSNEIANVSAGGTFATIQTMVDNAKAGSTIKLSGTYTGSGKAITVNKNLTIDGCGAILDAKELSQIFYVTGKGVTIKNIIFKNGSARYGGAIYWNGTIGTLTNCTFINCSSDYTDNGDGGSVYWAGSNGKLTYCKFLDSHNPNNGGAVYWTGANGVLATSTFTNSTSVISGGAISWSGVKGKVFGCTFTDSNCTQGSGGDIQWSGANGTLYNCTFLNSYSGSSAGSIYWNGEYANIYNSYFINSTARGQTNNQGSGGAIYLLKANGNITNCTFTGCSATTMSSPASGRGGAIALYDNANKTTITNCDFTDCYSIEGGAIYGKPSNVKITNTNFDNCSASDSAGAIYLMGSNNYINYCNFTECSSNSVGGAISYASSNSILNNSHFEDCSAVFGGAVYCAGSSIYLDQSEFINCMVNGSPMAISGSVSWAGDNGKLTNSKFINSTATSSSADATIYGGSVSWYGNGGKLANCTFNNSKIIANDNANSYGGAVYWTGANGDLTDCKFTNSSNKAGAENSYGGAICWNNTQFTINNSTFLDSFAEYGHAIYAENTTIYNSTFYINDDENETDMVYETDVDLLKSQNDKFLYSKYISILTAEDMVKDVTNKTSFTVKLTDRSGNPIYGNVTFTLDGVTYTVTTNTEGICRLQPTSQLPAGNYSITVFFEGKDPYYPSDNISAILTVNKIDADLRVFDVSNAYYAHEINLTAIIGNPDYEVEGPVIFYIDGVEVGSATVSNGKAILSYCPTKTGNFVIKAVYNGSDIYNPGSDVANITINKLNTSISVSSTPATYKSPVTLTAKVTSDVTVTDGQVSFYVDDVKVGSATVVDGVATCTYTPDKAGDFNVKVFYTNSSLFKDSNSSNTISVDKANVTVTLTQNCSYYKAARLIVKLVGADGTPIGGEKVSITIGGQTVNVTTNSEGIAIYNIPLPPSSNYYVASVSSASSNVMFDTTTKNIFIKKATDVIIYPYVLNTTYDSGKYFQVKVYKGAYLFAGVKLQLKIYTGSTYKTVTVVTDSNGIARYSASKLSIGKHKVIVSCAESTNYMTATAKTSYITINRALTTVYAPVVTNTYKQSAYFRIAVKNKATGKIVSGLKLQVKIYTGSTYKTYTITTNANGIALINTQALSKGTHKVVISSGNGYYTVSKSGNLIVIK